MHKPESTLPDLFDRAPYPLDPGYAPNDTSYEAAKSIKPSKDLMQQKVLDALRLNPLGLTSHQLAEKTGLPYGSVQPRTSELQEEKKILEGEERGKTPSGRSCIIWRLP